MVAERRAGTKLAAIMWFIAAALAWIAFAIRYFRREELNWAWFAGFRRAAVTAGTLLLLGSSTACEDDNALEPPRECAGPIALVVSSSTPPQFSWTVPCAVARVVVLEPPVQGTSAVAWEVRSTPPRIVSPVRYGDRPSGATEEQPPAALRSGETYQVRIYSGAQIVIGSASFVP